MNKRKIYGFLFVFVLCFIWGNSMLSGEISGAISHFVASLLGGQSGSGEEGHFLVRKLAHFTEYLGLGMIGYLFIDTFELEIFKKRVARVFIGMATPLIDETIQIFSGRGPAIADVWIDIAGYTCGALATALVICIVLKARKRAEIEK